MYILHFPKNALPVSIKVQENTSYFIFHISSDLNLKKEIDIFYRH